MKPLGSAVSMICICAALSACNAGPRVAGTAPALRENGDMPVLRNVADPNAPFTLRPRQPRLVERQPLLDVNNVPVCAENQLSLFETRSQISGNHHALRLTLENQGAACRLAGFPAVTLLGPGGEVLGDVQLAKVSPTELEATVGKAARVEDAGAVTEPSPEVLLPEHGDAIFELGWTSGPDCRQVSRIAVSAPGSTEAAYVPRRLALCEDRVLITAVRPGGPE